MRQIRTLGVDAIDQLQLGAGVVQFEHRLAQAGRLGPFLGAKIGDQIDGRGGIAGGVNHLLDGRERFGRPGGRFRRLRAPSACRSSRSLKSESIGSRLNSGLQSLAAAAGLREQAAA